jgi:hypothetical protein
MAASGVGKGVVAAVHDRPQTTVERDEQGPASMRMVVYDRRQTTVERDLRARFGVLIGPSRPEVAIHRP